MESMIGHLRPLFKQHPGYRLYITGHSLGASLAIITAYKLATISEIPSPITAIAIAPLRVGDIKFQGAFQEMEKKKRITCMCIVNNRDLIPLEPYYGGLGFYQPIGNQLRLCPGKKTEISYPSESGSLLSAWVKSVPQYITHTLRVADVFARGKKFWDHHNIVEYLDNLSGAKDLKEMTFNDIHTRRYN